MRPYFALLMAAAVLVSSGCSGNTRVSLRQLSGSEHAYVGHRVITDGVVRHERDPNGEAYFVLAGPRGALVGLKPAAMARRFEGQLVQVSGLFAFQPGFGRLIHIATIVPVEGRGH